MNSPFGFSTPARPKQTLSDRGIDRRILLRMGAATAAATGAGVMGAGAPAQADILPLAIQPSGLSVGTPSSSLSTSGRGAVLLTMDDGYLAMDTVRQMLDDRGQKGTFFITPGLMNGPTKISESTILSMVKSGHEVGAHSQTHANLTSLTQAQRMIELDQPKSYLEQLTGTPVTSFAYPFGTGAGGRNRNTDVELYLRYDRVFDTAQYNQSALLPRFAGAPTLIRRTCVDGTNHNQCLSMIREAAVRPVVASFFFHNLDTAINPSTPQLTEMLDLARSLGVELITASDAFGSNRMVANAGFEDSAADAYPWRWFKSGTGQLSISDETPAPGLPGQRSLHLSSSDGASYSEVRQAVEVTPGAAYTFSFRSRAVSGTWGTANVYGSVAPLDYDQAMIPGLEVKTAPVLPTNTGWAKFGLEFTAPPSCHTVLISLVVDGPRGGGRVAFDHVWLGPKCMPDMG